MKALMVGGPRNGSMVTVSAKVPEYVPDTVVMAPGQDPDDVWPPVWVDVVSATTYRRFPLHYMEMSTLVQGHVKTRWDAVVYLHETIRTDTQVGAQFPQAAALWWFRETGIPSDPNAPRPFNDERPASAQSEGDTPA